MTGVPPPDPAVGANEAPQTPIKPTMDELAPFPSTPSTPRLPPPLPITFAGLRLRVHILFYWPMCRAHRL